MNLRKIFSFWAPLEATWLMMALEGPYLAAIIARMDSPKLNLAAYGVALALGMLVEAPVIMVMSAATALVTDRDSYRKLRNFTWAMNLAITAVMATVSIPWVFGKLAVLLSLPEDLRGKAWAATALFIPWPAAIGYRRLYQGILIRQGKTRRVAYGTVIRLLGMTISGLSLSQFTDLDGASVGAASLSIAVVIEAVATRFMVRDALGQVWKTEPQKLLGYLEIGKFYYPLAMTSMLNMGIQPILTFFLARGASPIESLAVLPVVNSLVFLFRTFGLAGQETTIAVISKAPENRLLMRRFMLIIAAVSSASLGLITWTPLIDLWFGRVSGLTAHLVGFAVGPSRILTIMPAMTVWMCWQRGQLVSSKNTKATSVATLVEVFSVVLTMLLGNAAGLVGMVSASWALVIGRLASNGYLVAAGGIKPASMGE